MLPTLHTTVEPQAMAALIILQDHTNSKSYYLSIEANYFETWSI